MNPIQTPRAYKEYESTTVGIFMNHRRPNIFRMPSVGQLREVVTKLFHFWAMDFSPPGSLRFLHVSFSLPPVDEAELNLFLNLLDEEMKHENCA